MENIVRGALEGIAIGGFAAAVFEANRMTRLVVYPGVSRGTFFQGLE